jgi:hypothetical protein
VIPAAHIQAWAATTRWPDQRQVEQDLIISRALCDVFDEPYLADRLALRGGTAIHKLLFRHPLRYSEDIDLVQVRPEPIGHTVDAVRRALSWLGPCRRKSAAHSIHLVFSFSPEAAPATNAKLKIEINTREHENLYGIRTHPWPWRIRGSAARSRSHRSNPRSCSGPSFGHSFSAGKGAICSISTKD